MCAPEILELYGLVLKVNKRSFLGTISLSPYSPSGVVRYNEVQYRPMLLHGHAGICTHFYLLSSAKKEKVRRLNKIWKISYKCFFFFECKNRQHFDTIIISFLHIQS